MITEFNDIASSALELKTQILRPFKVCDFRPAFGHIFSGELQDTDYWGWGDIDVIYGNLDKLSHLLKKNSSDVMSARSQFISGQFCLLRNTSVVNSLYLSSKDWVRVATESRNYDFDEVDHFKDRTAQSFTEICMKAHLDKGLRLTLKDFGHDDKVLRKRALKLLWRDGELHDLLTGRESFLYHFIDRKNDQRFEIPSPQESENSGFQISESGVSVIGETGDPKLVWFNMAKEEIRDNLRRWISYRKLKQLVRR